MAKGERAKARAVREVHRARAVQAQQTQQLRGVQRRARWRRIRARLPRRTHVGRPQGILARRRRIQNAVALSIALAVQVLTWLLSDDWLLRGAVALVTVLALPVLMTLVLDRRP